VSILQGSARPNGAPQCCAAALMLIRVYDEAGNVIEGARAQGRFQRTVNFVRINFSPLFDSLYWSFESRAIETRLDASSWSCRNVFPAFKAASTSTKLTSGNATITADNISKIAASIIPHARTRATHPARGDDIFLSHRQNGIYAPIGSSGQADQPPRLSGFQRRHAQL
jgi:hypothetical protein